MGLVLLEDSLWGTFWSMSQPTIQTIRTLLTPGLQHHADSLPSDPISITLIGSNFIFPPPFFHTLNLHPHTSSLKLCLYNRKLTQSFGSEAHLLLGHFFLLVFMSLFRLNPVMDLEAKKGLWRWVLRTVIIVLLDNLLQWRHLSLISGNVKPVPSEGEPLPRGGTVLFHRRRRFSWIEALHQNVRILCPPQFTIYPYSFLINPFTLEVDIL